MLGEPKTGTQNRKIGVFIWILLRIYRKNTFFNIFGYILSFLKETIKEKVTQNGIWDILKQEKFR